jgi:hypothetical protein
LGILRRKNGYDSSATLSIAPAYRKIEETSLGTTGVAFETEVTSFATS